MQHLYNYINKLEHTRLEHPKCELSDMIFQLDSSGIEKLCYA